MQRKYHIIEQCLTQTMNENMELFSFIKEKDFGDESKKTEQNLDKLDWSEDY